MTRIQKILIQSFWVNCTWTSAINILSFKSAAEAPILASLSCRCKRSIKLTPVQESLSLVGAREECDEETAKTI